MNKKRLKNIVIHSTIWLFYIILNYYLAYFQQLKNVLFIDYFTKYLLVIPVFYINVYLILPKLFQTKKYLLFILAEAALAFAHYYLFYIVYSDVLPAFFNFPKLSFKFSLFFPRTFWWYFNFSLYGFGLWYATQVIEKQKQINELERKNYLAETNFLKSQINPHFLHNTLNTLFAQALPHSQELADNILRLSNMMRYSLESINREDGKVRLKDELQYLQDLIEINQVRFFNMLQINYEQTGVINGQMIPALSLITALENSFKYGNLKDKDNPLQIRVDALPNGVHFFCRNKKKTTQTELSSGTGIDNLRKRLDFQFPGKYELQTKNEKDFYTFDLTIHN